MKLMLSYTRDGNQMIYLAHYIRSIRIIRSLKLVTRFEKIRLVALAITKAFKVSLSIVLKLLSYSVLLNEVIYI